MRLHARYAREGVRPEDAEILAYHLWEAAGPPDAEWVWEGSGDLPALRHAALGAHLAAGRRYANRTVYGRAVETLAETPEAVQRLRRFILELGFIGRLADQDVASWKAVSLRDVATLRLGKMLDKAKNKGRLYPYLRNTNVQWLRFELDDDVKEMRFEDDEIEEFSLLPGDLLVCEGGEPGRCAIWDGRTSPMMFQKALHRIRPDCSLDATFLQYRLLSDAWEGRLESHFTGATIKHFTGQELARYRFSLPPLAEQRRIVAKVEELLALCDELEARQTAAREHRTRLVRSALDQLTTAKDEPDFRKHSAFVSNSWSLASPNGRRARKRWRINPA
jgi:hypothetical protein